MIIHVSMSKLDYWFYVNFFFTYTTTYYQKNDHTIKDTCHPKMKMLSSLNHPHIVSNLYNFLSSADHKRRTFMLTDVQKRWTSAKTKEKHNLDIASPGW